MYDTLKKCDRLKDKWTRKVQILSKKQHSYLFLSPNFIRIINKKSLPERFQRLHDFPVKQLYVK